MSIRSRHSHSSSSSAAVGGGIAYAMEELSPLAADAAAPPAAGLPRSPSGGDCGGGVGGGVPVTASTTADDVAALASVATVDAAFRSPHPVDFISAESVPVPDPYHTSNENYTSSE